LGEPQWRAVCDALAPFAPADITFERLRDAARSFLALPDLLLDLPPAIRKADNRLPVLKAAASLQAWGLL
ncbi:type II toxin-antitoxin system HipA family toxin, partial [Pseudomonas syringae pv. tomato]|nr:type II toxin-antitoxin system HipA family toxin [Pseudomonas syringae pv. tomato]